MSYEVVEQREPGDRAGGITIGIVTNMPPGTLRKTERQYRSLIDRAVPGGDVALRFFVLPHQLADALAANGSDRCYESLDRLWGAQLDALIVTGAEPQAVSMMDEPSWPTLARLVDWASIHTVSAIWSCLAAHAAVFKIDGLVRRSFPVKLSGVFACYRVSDHRLVADMPSSWPVPHSRHNDVNENGLIANGYRILSRAPRIGADAFIKHVDNSLFLFLQGHPEYDPESLMREYRRDVRRFLAGKGAMYPDMPTGYFSQPVCRALTDLRDRAGRMESSDVMSQLDTILETLPEHSWDGPAVELFARWLSYIADQKSVRERAAPLPESYALVRNG